MPVCAATEPTYAIFTSIYMTQANFEESVNYLIFKVVNCGNL